ncbi:MAG: DUF2207 domain-containing protein [Candidatus Dojkabacteria bacterium]|nr:DUF2207 domain-containing protein [Candidatus Dojkabacteria bacterium]
MSFLIGLTNVSFFVGIGLSFYAIFYVRKRYLKKGKDAIDIKTVVPACKPPTGISPYLLGSIKDAKVDKVDITGSIIDLAFRGYIKIKELKKGKNYELTKLENAKATVELDSIEKDLLEAIFGSKDKVETKDLSYTFVSKLKILEKDIYKKLETDGYFKEQPDTVRAKNTGIGITLSVFGVVLTVGLTVFIVTLMGILNLFTIGIAMLILGLGILLTAKYMPSKSEKGSKIFGEILGFKMYMETAEKYRVQNLEPKDFERYLSYAMVFEIEKGSGQTNLKNIYIGTPD